MERVAGDVGRLHLGIADLGSLLARPLVGPRVERTLDFEAGFSCRRRDQLDDGHAIGERSPAPVPSDLAEQKMLDLAPRRRDWRIVMDVEHEPGR